MATRRLRAFKRWMKSQGIESSEALEFTDTPEQGIAVKALCELKEGDVVATIPKQACLTVKTSGACKIIEAACLDGCLALAVAIMYERSLGEKSPWAGYLQLLPHHECLPLVWTLHEIDSLLCGTELHQIVKEDKALLYEDWKESILPLMDSASSQLNPKYFGVEQYIAAKSLIASRSFEIDGYHGSGMVPVADLFNHKTGAEDVHFTSVSSHFESDNEANNNTDVYANTDEDDLSTQSSYLEKKGLTSDVDNEADNKNDVYVHTDEDDPQSSHSDNEVSASDLVGKNSYSGGHLECASVLRDDPMVLEMIMVKDVKVGAEVFNTYGSLGNAALLHRYGFTEPDNPFDIVNIDLELVLQWSLSLFSGRYSRARLCLWRRLEYAGCISQDSEYFEVTNNGEPQIELLLLLYIMLLPDDAYHKLDLSVSTAGICNGTIGMILSQKSSMTCEKSSEMSKNLLATKSVCDALLSLADMRESFYGSNFIENDIEALRGCCCIGERKLYHSLMLRVSERRILQKLRTYAKQASSRKKTRTK